MLACIRRPLTLDGGTASQLIRHGYKIEHTPLWSAELLIQNPEAVATVHREFLDAGAKVIETNSYHASLETLQQFKGLSENDSVRVLKDSVALARTAVWKYCSDNGKSSTEHFVTGSVGPYAVVIHDGSEYSGGYINDVPAEAIIRHYLRQASALIEANVDCLAFETIPSLAEARLALQAMSQLPNVPMWISFSCKDGARTNFGDEFCDVVSELCLSPAVAMIGVNCTDPDFISPLLKQGAHSTKPFVVYPNSGEIYTTGGWSGKTKKLSNYCDQWLELGAKVIGGCCRVGPETINEISQILSARF